MNGRRLYRSEREHMLGGVAGGIAEYFDLDPSLVRVAWAVLIIASGGIFLLVYIVMWFVVPEAPPGYAASPAWSYPPRTDAGGGMPPPPPAAEAPADAAAAPGAGAAASVPPPAQPSYAAGDWAARRAERRRHRSGEGGVLVGAVLILIGAWFLVQNYLPWLRISQLWPVALILIGLLLLAGAFRRPGEHRP
jgi:phage shock protein C